MESQKSYVPIKLFLGYTILAALVIGVTIMLFSENAKFSKIENNIFANNSKLLEINSFISEVYKTESMARRTIQSGDQTDYDDYVRQTSALAAELGSLRSAVRSAYQRQLIDSVGLLLSLKKSNIEQLREIKSRVGNEAKVADAINDLTKMEESLRKLRLSDFAADPSKLEPHQLRVLKKYVSYLNQNIPSDSTNTLSQKVLDSMLVASRTVLNKVKLETEEKNRLLDIEEKKLLTNELSISNKLRAILTEIETEVTSNTARNNAARALAQNKIISIVTWAAVVGLVLALFFLLLILNDFMKTRKYKRQLELANHRTQSLLRSREQLISTVSHDLKTPLNTISGYSELINSTDPPRKLKYYNNNIKSASEYIGRLVQDLLDFTQLEAGKVTVDKIPFQLSEVVHEIATAIESVYHEKPIALSIIIAPEFNRRVIGDPFRLRQILTNLIGNAYKFTSEGSICIRAAIADAEISISIEDTGIGIAAEKQHLIFEEFTQADETVEKRFGGSGLGLTISRKMAEILGGTLYVESSVGRGSIFTLKLPLQFDHESIPAESLKLQKIAVVDDDVNLLNLTSEILRQMGHQTYTFQSADAALAEIANLDVDIVLTDIQMPYMDGFQLVERLQKTEWYRQKQIPFVAVTGKSDASKKLYSRAGFAAVIRKPYTLNNIKDAIAQVMHGQLHGAEGGNTRPIFSSNSMLHDFFSDDGKGMYHVLSVFHANAMSDIKLIAEALHVNNFDAVRHTAHRIRPMYQQLRASKISELLQQLEDGTEDNMAGYYHELVPEVRKLLVEIEQKLILQTI